jgi:hypothetical protein
MKLDKKFWKELIRPLTKGRGFKPGRGDGYLRTIKIRNTPSFGWEVKPEVHVVRFYGMLKVS